MIYEAECMGVDPHPFEYVASLAQCTIVPPCPYCQAPSKKVVRTAPMGVVTGKFDPFVSPVDGSVISTKRELAEHNKRNKVVQLGEGYTEEKVIKGDFGQKPVEPDKKEIAETILEAAQAVSHGYKPTVQVLEDD